MVRRTTTAFSIAWFNTLPPGCIATIPPSSVIRFKLLTLRCQRYYIFGKYAILSGVNTLFIRHMIFCLNLKNGILLKNVSTTIR